MFKIEDVWFETPNCEILVRSWSGFCLHTKCFGFPSDFWNSFSWVQLPDWHLERWMCGHTVEVTGCRGMCSTRIAFKRTLKAKGAWKSPALLGLAPRRGYPHIVCLVLKFSVFLMKRFMKWFIVSTILGKLPMNWVQRLSTAQWWSWAYAHGRSRSHSFRRTSIRITVNKRKCHRFYCMFYPVQR